MHSPAPWRAERSSEYTDDEEDITLLSVRAADDAVIIYTDGGYFVPRDEDVALVIAAPKLLEALALILAALRCNYEPATVLSEYGALADAAIATAKGKP